MSKNDLIIALVVGLTCIILISNVVYDKQTIILISMAFLGGLVYMAKRKKKTRFSKDRDLCLSISNLLHQQTPHKNRENQFIFFREENSCASAYWSGRFIDKSSAFQLSDEALNTLTELVDALYFYYRQNNLGDWNVLHFHLAANKRKHNLHVEFDNLLATGAVSFHEYLHRFANSSYR